MTGASDWSGKVGDVWASEWRRTDRSFAALSDRLDAAILDMAPIEGRAVDIGCGAGSTSIALAAARPGLMVTGVDLSTELVAVARERSAGLANLDFAIGDVAAGIDAFLPPDRARPDLIVSRHGVMFFAEPEAAFARLARDAAPDARLVFSCFRNPANNPWATDLVADVTGATPTRAEGYAPGPFGFADPDFVTAMLEGAGWRDVAAEPIDYRYVAGAGDDPIGDAMEFLRRIGPIAAALREAPRDDQPRLLGRLRAALERRCDDGTVTFPAAAWLWRARAGKG
jgi:SAM-dependent methyltransferase